MSTHARIGLTLHDGTIKHSYVHFDGYPEGVGETLVMHYNDIEKIEELLSFGDMSTLQPSIHPQGTHTFEKREDGVCLFYNRDRGETNVDAVVSSMDELHSIYYNSVDYYYLYSGGNWFVKNVIENEGWDRVEKFLPAYTLTEEDYACTI